MISPMPELELLWDLTEDPFFCDRFPKAAQAARGSIVAVAQIGGLLTEALEGEGRDSRQDEILVRMIADELAEQVKAIGGSDGDV